MPIFITPIYPGVNPGENVGPRLNIVSAVFVSISFLAVTIRFTSRRVTCIKRSWDDWLIIIATILSWAYSVGVVFEVQINHYGQHVGKTDTAHLKAWYQGIFAIAILYPIALMASKLSLLALLYRIFGVDRKARISMWIVTGLNIGWTITTVFVGSFGCGKVRGSWEPNRTCFLEYRFCLTNQCIAILLDLVVILMPVFFIAQIKRSFSQRLSIASTFVFGLIVTVVSAVRLWQLVVAERKPGFDPTFNQFPAGLLAVVELNVWIVVACIPAFRPLFSHIYTRMKSDENLSFVIGPFTVQRKRSIQSQTSSNGNLEHNTPPNSNGLPGKTRRKIPDIFGSLLASTVNTNRDAEADNVEMGEGFGILVEREVEVSRTLEKVF